MKVAPAQRSKWYRYAMLFVVPVGKVRELRPNHFAEREHHLHLQDGNEDRLRIRLVFQANREMALAITPPFS